MNEVNNSDCTIKFDDEAGLNSEKNNVYGTVKFRENWKFCKLLI